MAQYLLITPLILLIIILVFYIPGRVVLGRLKIISGLSIFACSVIIGMISKVIRRSYPVAESAYKKHNPIVSTVLRFIFRIEKSFAFPLGTGIIFCGIKRKINIF